MRNPGAGGSRTPSKTTPCCSKVGIKRGPWTAEEDEILSGYIQREGEGAWRTLPKRAGLLRCGKSCRLRWMNYLRPHLNRGPITPDEEDLILRLHRLLGNRWSLIAGRIPGRTDNEIKNYWNTHLSKKLISQGLDPRTHKPLEIYNPNPNNSNNSHEEVINDDARAQDSMAAMPNPNNPILPATTTTRISLPVMLNEEDALMTSGYNEDMYFSSFLDSLIMSDDCVFQDHSMAMMQPMGGNCVWGSDHEVSPLMASAFSESRNLDPADMQTQ